MLRIPQQLVIILEIYPNHARLHKNTYEVKAKSAGY